MARYWLTPVDGEDPLVLGGDRRLLQEGPTLEVFRSKLQRAGHPRFLSMVKAAILPGDPSEEVNAGASCGSVEAISLAVPGEIMFDGVLLGLSECGRAFIDRLPLLREQEEWLGLALMTAATEGWTDEERLWLQTMEAYVRSGRKVMLVKEE